MKIKKMFLLITLTGFFSLANAQTEIKTADEVVNKYIVNTGGAEKWKALTSRKSNVKMSMQGMDFPGVVYEKPADKQKLVMQVQGNEIIQAYDGIDAWMLNPFAGGKDPIKLNEEQSKDMKDQKFESDFIDYKKKGHEISLIGTEEVDGVKCYKIQLIKNKNNDKEDVTEIHFFDSENFVPIMMITYVKSGPQKGQEIKTYLSDYQEVSGLMMPFFIESKMNGQTIQKLTVEKVFLNEPIDDSIFAFPKK